MCRREIPQSFLEHPALLSSIDLGRINQFCYELSLLSIRPYMYQMPNYSLVLFNLLIGGLPRNEGDIWEWRMNCISLFLKNTFNDTFEEDFFFFKKRVQDSEGK